VTFSATSSDPDGNLDRIELSVDNTVVSSQNVSGENASHQFQLNSLTEGTYNLQAKVTDQDGLNATQTISILVIQDNGDGGIVKLPINVIPPDGRGVHVESVSVNITDPSGVEKLYLRAHSLGYKMTVWSENGNVNWDDGEGGSDPNDRHDKKASFRINGGNWIDLSNDNVTCLFPESEYECVGGAFQTIRLEVPIQETGSLVAGANQIDFRFNGTEGVTSSYRILELELRKQSGTNAIDGTQFKMQDPDNWQAPSGYRDQMHIDEGYQLWTEEGILLDGGGDNISLTQKQIGASCANCHALDGRDLQYFNYSNESIIARSRFHGLSEDEGKKIAAYIRSIDLELPNYDCDGDGNAEARKTVCGAWPWNPPYQPGPGLDDKPVEWWAAGAGVDAVLDHDLDAFPYAQQAFQQGKTDVYSVLNVREFPLAVQFPDWNSWLPEMAPQDIWTDFETTLLHDRMLVEIPEALDTPQKIDALVNETAANICAPFLKGLVGLMKNTAEYPIAEIRPDSGYGNQRYPFNKDTLKGKLSWFQQDASIRKWHVVRLWELMQKHKLEDLGEELYQPENECGEIQFLHDRHWPRYGMDLFAVSPHMIQRRQSSCIHESERQCEYFSSMWYELQLVVGMGQSSRSRSMDWNYQGALIRSSSRPSHPQFVRGWRNLIATWQTRREGNIWRFPENDSRNSNRAETFKFRQGHWAGSSQSLVKRLNEYNFDGDYIDPDKRRQLIEWAMTEFTEKIWMHPFEEWEVCPESDPNRGDDCLEPPSIMTPQGQGTNFIGQMDYNNMFYKGLMRLSQDGIDPILLDKNARWADHFWPNADFERWICQENGGLLNCQ
jgi:hypothetical protein